jgi:hypothetical protein
MLVPYARIMGSDSFLPRKALCTVQGGGNRARGVEIDGARVGRDGQELPKKMRRVEGRASQLVAADDPLKLRVAAGILKPPPILKAPTWAPSRTSLPPALRRPDRRCWARCRNRSRPRRPSLACASPAPWPSAACRPSGGS